MIRKNNKSTQAEKELLLFQKKHPSIHYNGFDTEVVDIDYLKKRQFKVIDSSDKYIQITFKIDLTTIENSIKSKINFRPKLYFPISNMEKYDQNSLYNFHEDCSNLINSIAMVEIISYWKVACPPVIQINSCHFSDEQITFFTKLYKHGLSEFFYVNNLDYKNPPLPKFIINYQSEKNSNNPHVNRENNLDRDNSRFDKLKFLLPIGGGKDSCVSLHILQKLGKTFTPFLLNKDPASIDTLKAANISLENCIYFFRSIDNNLLKLNKSGYLNGHTPFSALLAFISYLAAQLNDHTHIALSNESSANEATVDGEKVNHQYSKSYEFEKDFRNYATKYLDKKINYFSLLRPLNEIQIVKIFSRLKQFHNKFRSCNVGGKFYSTKKIRNKWCGDCPKCLFVALIMQIFNTSEEIDKIFCEKNPLNDESLYSILLQLIGFSDHKPFECIGTSSESLLAAILIYKKLKNKKLPILISKLNNEYNLENLLDHNLEKILLNFNNNHFVDAQLEKFIKILIKA